MNAIVSFITNETKKILSQESFQAFERFRFKWGLVLEVGESDPLEPEIESKFRFIKKMLWKYDRVLYLDPQVLLRFDCPNLFDLVPEGKIGFFNESECNPSLLAFARDMHPNTGVELKQVFNTDVFVASRVHSELFSTPPFPLSPREEKAIISQRIADKNTPVFLLNHRLNRLLRTICITGEQVEDSFILNCSEAFEEGLNDSNRLFWINISEVFRKYERDGQVPVFRKRIYIETAGALGDVVSTEPVIRYIRKILEPEADVTIKTEFPDVFSHLQDYPAPFKILGPGETTPDMGHLRIYLFPDPPIANYNLMPPVDYAALAAFRGQLPKAHRGIELKVTAEPPIDVSEHVLVHAGLSWESKTFPTSWWQEVIDGMINKGLKVALIGRTYEGNWRGTVELDPTYCLDLRNKTTLPELFAVIKQAPLLISNDSSPVHIAGAFNNPTIMITSAKHPDFIWPARAEYLNITMGQPMKNSAPAVGIVNSTFMDRCDPEELMAVLPKPEDVVNRAVEVLAKRPIDHGHIHNTQHLERVFANGECVFN